MSIGLMDLSVLTEDKDSDLEMVGSRRASTRSWWRGDRSGRSDSRMSDVDEFGDEGAWWI